MANVAHPSTDDVARRRWIILIVLTSINLLNYIDRYIFSALAPALQKDLGLNDTQLGLLGSAFILAYIVVAPVCGWWGDRGSRSRVMALGVGLWSLATAFSGIARSFAGQMATRIAVGVGESAYTVIAPTTIADAFPKTSRGKIFAIYSGAIPVGSALGYLLGGALEAWIGWQKAFFVVGVPGLFCAAILFVMRDPPRGEHETNALFSDRAGETANPWLRFARVCRTLFKNGGFNCVVLGYAAYTFVVGGMAFWMPSYIVRYFDVSLAKGNMIFGAVTVVGGFVGTLVGGWWADHLEKTQGNGYLKVSVFSMVLAVPLMILTLQQTDFTSFTLVLFLMEVALFLCISPLDAAVINYVRPNMRATAMALNIFLIHALGDGISRALIGSISDGSSLKSAIAFCPPVLVLAGVAWLIGLLHYWQVVPWPKGGADIPRFQAHRGLWKPTGLQENTLEAFRAARAAGASMVEMDVQLSGDGQVVVFHDETLQRLAGRPERVRDVSARDLKNWANVPTLEDVLRDPEVTPLLNVELKTREVRDGSLEDEVARVVERTGAHGRIVFSSFNPFSVRRLARRLPTVPRALLATDYQDAKNPIWLRRMWLAFFARPHLVHLDKNMCTPERVEDLQERNVPIVVWTVNDKDRARQLLDWRVRGIISDEILALNSPEART